MKDKRTADSRNPFDLLAMSGQERPDSNPPLPEGWQRLATGLRGARLYRVRLPFGINIYWEAGVMLNGELVHRRFASELHARAWLSMAVQPHTTSSTLNLEELNGPLRAAGIIRSA